MKFMTTKLRSAGLAACLAICWPAAASLAQDWQSIGVGEKMDFAAFSKFPRQIRIAFRTISREREEACSPDWPEVIARVYRPRPKVTLVQVACIDQHLAESWLFRLERGRLVQVALPWGGPKKGFTVKTGLFLDLGIDQATGALFGHGSYFCDACGEKQERDESYDYADLTFELNSEDEFVLTSKQTYTHSGKLRRIEFQATNKP
jgi:hypothetical protein